MQRTVPVPLALQQLIIANNKLLKSYQAELSNVVFQSNEEMMLILNLQPADGWRLNLDTMEYIRDVAVTPSDTSIQGTAGTV